MGLTCEKCKKHDINPMKTRTRIIFGNYKYHQITQLTQGLAGGKYLCQKCSDKLKDWLNK